MGEMGVKKTLNYVIGISSIALVVLVILIIFGNLSGNIGITSTTSIVYVNESGFVNQTGYTPTGVNLNGFMSFTIQQIGGNYSGDYFVIPATNYTQTGNAIYNLTSVDANGYGYNDAGITYTATYRSGEYLNAEGTITNLTGGMGRLVSQFPTILLFVGIGLLLFVLIGVLAWVIKKMSGLGGRERGNLE